MARGDKVARGEAAKRVLNDPILKEAFEAAEKHLVNTLAATTLTGDNEAFLMEKVRELQANRRVQVILHQYVQYGSAEANRIEASETVPKAVKDPRFK
jgi:hypothetical protein